MLKFLKDIFNKKFTKRTVISTFRFYFILFQLNKLGIKSKTLIF